MDPNRPNSFVNLLTGSASTEGEPTNRPTNPGFQMHSNFLNLTTFPPYPIFPPHPMFQNMCTQNFQPCAAIRPFYQTLLPRVPTYQPSLQNQSNLSGASNSTPSSAQTPISTPATIESATEEIDTAEELNPQASQQPNESRNIFWSKEEDASLISAYVNISNDPIIGADQTKDGFWNRIQEHYKHYAPPNARARNKKQIHARWHRCAPPTQKFIGFVDEIIQLHPSGVNEDDMINRAHALYEQREGKRFQFEHWWRALRHLPKWQSFAAPTPRTSKRVKINESGRHSQSSTQGSEEQSVDLNIADIELSRPIGRKAAKRREKEKEKGKGKAGDSSAKNKILELKERDIKAKEKKADAMVRLTQQLVDYNEVKIMLVDTSNMSPQEAHYWNEKKAAIMRRANEGNQST